jgi:RNA-directed DNA polymerase
LQEEQYETSVPTVRDRVAQAAAKLVLEPIFEADFLSCSGFLSNRDPSERSADTLATT